MLCSSCWSLCYPLAGTVVYLPTGWVRFAIWVDDPTAKPAQRIHGKSAAQPTDNEGDEESFALVSAWPVLTRKSVKDVPDKVLRFCEL